jgi:CPA1 family monovalent cation:H+ antiporter
VPNARDVVLLLIAAALATVVARWIRVSYVLVLLALGLILSAFDVVPTPALRSDVILLIFLPPLLFESSFMLDLRLLWRLRGGVLALAFPGVLVAMAAGGVIAHVGHGFPWSVALLFGAMIAATDPVAVLATFRQLGVEARLSLLLEGESLLNDGVALVLFATLVETVESGFHPGRAIGLLVVSILGGTVVGAAIGWLAYRLIARVDDHLTEMIVTVAGAYGSFLAAEQIHLSGVLATITAAAVLGHLSRARTWIFATGSEDSIIQLWQFLAFIANAGLFLLMGLDVRASGLLNHKLDVLIGVVAALAGRAVVAYGFGWLLNARGFRVPSTERHVLFWGGLRGAVALAAALSLPSDFPYRDRLLAMTYGAVLFTLLVQGLTITPLVRRLGLLQSGAPKYGH